MSKYTQYYNARQIMYRNLAIRWKKWSITAKLTEKEQLGMISFFKFIAKRFGLVAEFKKIGVL